MGSVCLCVPAGAVGVDGDHVKVELTEVLGGARRPEIDVDASGSSAMELTEVLGGATG